MNFKLKPLLTSHKRALSDSTRKKNMYKAKHERNNSLINKKAFPDGFFTFDINKTKKKHIMDTKPKMNNKYVLSYFTKKFKEKENFKQDSLCKVKEPQNKFKIDLFCLKTNKKGKTNQSFKITPFNPNKSLNLKKRELSSAKKKKKQIRDLNIFFKLNVDKKEKRKASPLKPNHTFFRKKRTIDVNKKQRDLSMKSKKEEDSGFSLNVNTTTAKNELHKPNLKRLMSITKRIAGSARNKPFSMPNSNKKRTRPASKYMLHKGNDNKVELKKETSNIISENFSFKPSYSNKNRMSVEKSHLNSCMNDVTTDIKLNCFKTKKNGPIVPKVFWKMGKQSNLSQF